LKVAGFSHVMLTIARYVTALTVSVSQESILFTEVCWTNAITVLCFLGSLKTRYFILHFDWADSNGQRKAGIFVTLGPKKVNLTSIFLLFRIKKLIEVASGETGDSSLHSVKPNCKCSCSQDCMSV
jgi:hypothetical protein